MIRLTSRLKSKKNCFPKVVETRWMDPHASFPSSAELGVTSSAAVLFLPWLSYAELDNQIGMIYCNNQYHNSRRGPNPKTKPQT